MLGGILVHYTSGVVILQNFDLYTVSEFPEFHGSGDIEDSTIVSSLADRVSVVEITPCSS